MMKIKNLFNKILKKESMNEEKELNFKNGDKVLFYEPNCLDEGIKEGVIDNIEYNNKTNFYSFTLNGIKLDEVTNIYFENKEITYIYSYLGNDSFIISKDKNTLKTIITDDIESYENSIESSKDLMKKAEMLNKMLENPVGNLETFIKYFATKELESLSLPYGEIIKSVDEQKTKIDKLNKLCQDL